MQPLTIFIKSFILDVWQGFEYVFDEIDPKWQLKDDLPGNVGPMYVLKINFFDYGIKMIQIQI